MCKFGCPKKNIHICIYNIIYVYFCVTSSVLFRAPPNALDVSNLRYPQLIICSPQAIALPLEADEYTFEGSRHVTAVRAASIPGVPAAPSSS